MTALIPAGGLRRFKSDGLGDLVVGSVTANSDQPLGGFILFGGLNGLAGVPDSVAHPIGFVAPMETNTVSEINTGIAVMNLEDSPVDLTLQIADEDGAVLASAQAVLPGLGHLATLPVVFLPVKLAEDSSTELDFAQFADGAGLFSQIILFNPDPDLEANLTLVLRDDEGNPLNVDLNGEQVSGQMTALIPAGGLRRFGSDGLGDLTTGWVQVTSDRTVAGVVLFGGTNGLAGVGSSANQPTGFVDPRKPTPDLRSTPEFQW